MSSRIVTFKISKHYLDLIDAIVAEGRYTSRSEFIRTAIRELIRAEMLEKTMTREILAQTQLQVGAGEQ